MHFTTGFMAANYRDILFKLSPKTCLFLVTDCRFESIQHSGSPVVFPVAKLPFSEFRREASKWNTNRLGVHATYFKVWNGERVL
jgi:hypothetical protein